MSFATTTLTNSYALGKDGVLTVGGVTLGGVKSVDVSQEADEVDATTRDDGGFAKSLPGKRAVSLEVTCNKSEDDAGQVGLRGLWLDDEYSTKGVAVSCKSGTSGSGFSGTFVLTSISESQDMDGMNEVTFSLKSFGSVTEITATSSGGGGAVT